VKAIAINGSPRKDWNTATMLRSALEGAESAGAETKLVHLYDLAFKGCTSCFACKRKGNSRAGLCAMRDELTDVLVDIFDSDVLIVGSPVYFFDVTGEVRSFLERLLFPSISYDEFGTSTFVGRISCGFVFTMNCPEDKVNAEHLGGLFDRHAFIMRVLRGESEVVTAHETWQFDDYSKFNGAMFDVAARAKRRAERFPLDCRRAFEMGARLVKGRADAADGL
jgi:multimeric flavodoxin WrbA